MLAHNKNKYIVKKDYLNENRIYWNWKART
jgi:hypothetical protein